MHDVSMTSVQGARDPVPIENWEERQFFCNATYAALQDIASAHGFTVQNQRISHEVNDVLAFGDIGFAKESYLTWVEWFYCPLAVEALIPKALPMVARHMLEVPAYGGEGRNDKDLSAQANARHIIEDMNTLARTAPSSQGYVDFLRSGRHPHRYREIEVLCLVADNKPDDAKRLCADILRGDVEYSSRYSVSAPSENAETLIHVIAEWLDQHD